MVHELAEDLLVADVDVLPEDVDGPLDLRRHPRQGPTGGRVACATTAAATPDTASATARTSSDTPTPVDRATSSMRSSMSSTRLTTLASIAAANASLVSDSRRTSACSMPARRSSKRAMPSNTAPVTRGSTLRSCDTASSAALRFAAVSDSIRRSSRPSACAR